MIDIEEFEQEKQIAKKFRSARKASRLTIEKVAELSNVSVSTISGFERGKTNVSLNTFLMMLKAINLEPESFFKTDNKTEIGAMYLLESMSKDDQEIVFDFIDMMYKRQKKS